MANDLLLQYRLQTLIFKILASAKLAVKYRQGPVKYRPSGSDNPRHMQ